MVLCKVTLKREEKSTKKKQLLKLKKINKLKGMNIITNNRLFLDPNTSVELICIYAVILFYANLFGHA